jgi:hypothetical protein
MPNPPSLAELRDHWLGDLGCGRHEPAQSMDCVYCALAVVLDHADALARKTHDFDLIVGMVGEYAVAAVAALARDNAKLQADREWLEDVFAKQILHDPWPNRETLDAVLAARSKP